MSNRPCMAARECEEPAISAQGERGFTLLEVLVALTILSLSVTVLFGIFSAGLDRTRQDSRATQARVLAESLLAKAESEPPHANANGIDGSGLSWNLQVTPFGQRGAIGSGVSAETVSATVRWRLGNHDRALTLTTLVLAPRESGS